MGDFPHNGLMQQMHAHPHSGEYLEVLGKKAAARWSSGEHKTLTESVTATVKEAQLSPEQVKRVVEFANTSAYLGEFKKEGAHKVVDFPGGPADMAEILQDLNDGGGGSTYDRGTSDYNAPPGGSTTKTASADDGILSEAFGAAPADLPFENPHGEVIELRDKVAGALDHLQTQVSGLEVAYAELGARLYNQVKQAALSGVSLGDVMQAWETVAPSPDHIKVAFTLITPQLLRGEVFHSVEEMTASVDKVASAKMVNMQNPLVTEFDEFCEVLSKLAELREARTELRQHHRSLTGYIKTAFDAGLVGEAWRGAKSVAGGAARTVRPLAHKALGPHAADAVAWGIEHAPHAALAVGANELNTRVENSPSMPARAARAVKHTALRQIPGTTDNLMHKYEIQNGQ